MVLLGGGSGSDLGEWLGNAKGAASLDGNGPSRRPRCVDSGISGIHHIPAHTLWICDIILLVPSCGRDGLGLGYCPRTRIVGVAVGGLGWGWDKRGMIQSGIKLSMLSATEGPFGVCG